MLFILAFIVPSFCYRLFKDDAAKTFLNPKTFFSAFPQKLLEIVFNDILTSPASIQVSRSHENMKIPVYKLFVLYIFA